DYVRELHQIATDYAVHNAQALMPEIKDYVDVVMIAADDWGSQNNTFASPDVYRDLFLPYRKQLNDVCHAAAPDTKLFLHSCGAIYNLIDLIAESGFDILNPVQWPAGGHSYQEWKDRARGKLSLWGGGIDAQHFLPNAAPDEIRSEARKIASYLGQDGGYVFCNIHNLLAEVPPDKVIALYQAV
ncbi:MAG: uroporphyrinogen decarboxylase family protein, partial [Anaerolineae bacterium]